MFQCWVLASKRTPSCIDIWVSPVPVWRCALMGIISYSRSVSPSCVLISSLLRAPGLLPRSVCRPEGSCGLRRHRWGEEEVDFRVRSSCRPPAQVPLSLALCGSVAALSFERLRGAALGQCRQVKWAPQPCQERAPRVSAKDAYSSLRTLQAETEGFGGKSHGSQWDVLLQLWLASSPS